MQLYRIVKYTSQQNFPYENANFATDFRELSFQIVCSFFKMVSLMFPGSCKKSDLVLKLLSAFGKTDITNSQPFMLIYLEIPKFDCRSLSRKIQWLMIKSKN